MLEPETDERQLTLTVFPETLRLVTQNFDKLEPKYQQVLNLRFQRKTLEETAMIMGLHKNRSRARSMARQLQNKAINLLRKLCLESKTA